LSTTFFKNFQESFLCVVLHSLHTTPILVEKEVKSMANLEEQVVDKLLENGYTISFAESCTGGLCAATIVNVPNASSVLSSSIVTYSPEAKIAYLHVDPTTIQTYGVVSEPVAAQMAEGMAKLNCDDIAVGVTGIAGPSGGTPDLPVGTVCFGFSIPGEASGVRITRTFTKHFGDIGRQNVRKSSVSFVLETLLSLLP
jgi:PncC family amidohydrolase